MAEHILTAARGALAFDAAYEITRLAQTLYKFAEHEDPSGELTPVCRGICMRMVSLSEVITTAINSNPGDASTPEELARIIGCEVRHG